MFVDVAGDARVRSDVHRLIGPRLERSIIVGATHYGSLAAAGEPLSGPVPGFFYALTV